MKPWEIVVTEMPRHDPGAWIHEYRPIEQQEPVIIGLTVEAGTCSIGPFTETGQSFMKEHLPWFSRLTKELDERFLHTSLRARRFAPRGQCDPPDEMLPIINARLRYAFGPLVQCVHVKT